METNILLKVRKRMFLPELDDHLETKKLKIPIAKKALSFCPYWTNFTKDLSERMTYFTKTNSIETNIKTNAWFRKSEIKNITDDKYQSIWKETLKSVDNFKKNEKVPKTKKKTYKEKEIPKIAAGKTKKIKLDLTTNQRDIINGWFGTARWTYNKCLEEIIRLNESNNQQKDSKDKVKLFDKKYLRSKFINEICHKDKETEWVLKTPYAIRDEAMSDVIKAYKSNFTSIKNRENKSFKIKFKKKKAPSDSITIRSDRWKNRILFQKTLGKDPIKGFEPIPDQLVYDTRLKRDHLGNFYLCVLSPIEIRSDNQAPKSKIENEGNIISLDPGVRTFMTGYDPSGTAYEFGKGDSIKLYKLQSSWSKLQSKWSQKNVKHQQKRNMKKAGKRIWEKIKNLVKYFHCKLVKWLVTNYNYILLPKFETSKMVQKKNRKIGCMTVSAMMMWSHYSFQQRLINKTREYPWCKVLIVDEQYTSKTCGICGNIHQYLGSNKIFNCPKCKIEMDRDVNAARNIYLRFLTLNKKELEPSSSVGIYTPSSKDEVQNL